MNNSEQISISLPAADMQKLMSFISMLSSNDKTNTVSIETFEIEYLSFIKANYSKGYYDSVASAFKHLKRFFSPAKQLNELDLKVIENFISYLQQKVKKGWRVYYRDLKAAFNKAISWKYIYKNPFVEIKLPKRQKLPPAYLTRDQLELVCNNVKKEKTKDFYRFAFNTGLRRSEQINLFWSDVDLKNKTITVGSEKFITKSRKQRIIPLNDEAFNILEKYLPKIFNINSNYVFRDTRNRPFTGDRVTKNFKLACREAKIDERITYHSLRHSFASAIAQAGGSIYEIKELLGHSSISVTEIYSHLSFENLRNAVSKIKNDAEDKERRCNV